MYLKNLFQVPSYLEFNIFLSYLFLAVKYTDFTNVLITLQIITQTRKWMTASLKHYNLQLRDFSNILQIDNRTKGNIEVTSKFIF